MQPGRQEETWAASAGQKLQQLHERMFIGLCSAEPRQEPAEDALQSRFLPAATAPAVVERDTVGDRCPVQERDRLALRVGRVASRITDAALPVGGAELLRTGRVLGMELEHRGRQRAAAAHLVELAGGEVFELGRTESECLSKALALVAHIVAEPVVPDTEQPEVEDRRAVAGSQRQVVE